MAEGKVQIKKIVEDILRADKQARDSDRYLFIEVIRKTNPNALYQPFYLTMSDSSIPCMETVRRSRQWVQAHFPELGASDNVEAARELEEDSYKEVFARYGRAANVC